MMMFDLSFMLRQTAFRYVTIFRQNILIKRAQLFSVSLMVKFSQTTLKGKTLFKHMRCIQKEGVQCAFCHFCRYFLLKNRNSVSHNIQNIAFFKRDPVFFRSKIRSYPCRRCACVCSLYFR